MRRSFLLALLLALSSCLPNLNTLQAPSFRYVPEGSGLLRLDPPGVGEAAAVFRLNLEVGNPNAFGLELARLDGTLALNGRPLANSRLLGGVRVPAQGAALLPLEVHVPLAEGMAVLGDLAALLAGEPVEVRVEAAPVVAFGQLAQPLPPLTVVATTLQSPTRLIPPSFAIDARASGLREVSLGRARYDLVLDAHNPGPLGYVLEAGPLSLSVGGARVLGASSARLALPAFGHDRLTLSFEAAPDTLALLLSGVLVGRGEAAAVLLGELSLELPGLLGVRLEPGVLARGALR